MGENIPAPVGGGNFNLEEYMTSIMRNPRPVVRREDIAELPAFGSLEGIYNRWVYLPKLMRHDGEWKVAVNGEQGGNSYFAAVAMLIYGDPEMWFWVRIQHIQFFEQTLDLRWGGTAHPRRGLYRRFNDERSGPNNFSVQERMRTTDCWADHQLLSQVTADLYGIYLVIYTYHSGREGTPSIPVFNEVYTATQARGNYDSPHRFLRYRDNRHYEPIVPSGIPYTTEFRSPQLKFNRGAAGIENPNIVSEENEGINHPWRKPYPDVPVPEQLVPTPITTLVLKDQDTYLEEILWVKFGTPPDRIPSPQRPTPAKDAHQRGSSQTFNIHGGSGKGGVTIDISNNGVPRTPNTIGNEIPVPNKPVQLPLIPEMPTNYYRKSLKELERLIGKQNIKIPDNVKSIRDDEERKKRYAAYLGGNDLQRAAGGRSASDILDFAEGPRTVTGDSTTTQVTTRQERAGGVLRQITTTNIVRTITSVPSTLLPVDPLLQTSPNRAAIDFNALTDKELQQLFLSVKLDITGDRETDIDAYRSWRKRTPGDKQPRLHTNPAAIQLRNELGGNRERSIIFHTTINVTTTPGSTDGTVIESKPQKRPRPDDEPDPTADPEPDPIAEPEPEPESNPPEEYLDVEDHQSSPEPESPVANDYSTWTAAALKRNAAARDPPIKVPSKQKAAETTRVLRPQLKGLDEQARAARNAIREAKRARIETRREAAKMGERPQKRLKVTVKENGKEKGKEKEAQEGKDNYEADGGDVADVVDAQAQGEECEEEVEGSETGEVVSTPAPEEGESEIYEGLIVETPAESGGGRDDSIEP